MEETFGVFGARHSVTFFLCVTNYYGLSKGEEHPDKAKEYVSVHGLDVRNLEIEPILKIVLLLSNT